MDTTAGPPGLHDCDGGERSMIRRNKMSEGYGGARLKTTKRFQQPYACRSSAAAKVQSCMPCKYGSKDNGLGNIKQAALLCNTIFNTILGMVSVKLRCYHVGYPTTSCFVSEIPKTWVSGMEMESEKELPPNPVQGRPSKKRKKFMTSTVGNGNINIS